MTRHPQITSEPSSPANSRYFMGSMVLFCSLLLIAGCEKQPPEQPKIVRPVKILIIGGPGSVSQREYPATIKATQQANMGFEVPGRIVEFLGKEGQVVEAGELLARLDDRHYQAELEKTKANQRKAAADLNRSLAIYRQDSGAISKGAIESDRRAKEVTDAAVLQAEKKVEDTRLRAPFEGYVARKLVEDFANVQAREPVLILQDLSRLEVEVNVPERDIVAGTLGKSAEEITATAKPLVSITSLPDRSFPAQVKELATTADPQTRTFQFRLVFDRPDDVVILPGMTATVRVQVPKQGDIRIPVAAVASDAQHQSFVWKVDSESMTVSRAPVEMDELRGAEVSIKSGLQVGDMIAISGLRQLEDGMEVRRYGG